MGKILFAFIILLILLVGCNRYESYVDLKDVDWKEIKLRCSLYYPAHNEELIKNELGIDPIDCQALIDSEVEPCNSNSDCQAYSTKIGGAYPKCYNKNHEFNYLEKTHFSEQDNRTFWYKSEAKTYRCQCDSNLCVFKHPQLKPKKIQPQNEGAYFGSQIEYIDESLILNNNIISLKLKNNVEFQNNPDMGIAVGYAKILTKDFETSNCNFCFDQDGIPDCSTNDLVLNNNFEIWQAKGTKTLSIECGNLEPFKMGNQYELILKIYYGIDSDKDFYNENDFNEETGRITTKDGSSYPLPHFLSGKVIISTS